MHDKLLKGLAGFSLIALSACGPAASSNSEQSLHTIQQGMGSWSSTPASLYYGGRRDHTATVLSGGDVLVAGGYNSVDLDTAEIYSSGSWSAVPNLMNDARSEHAATLLSTTGHEVLVTGGFNSSGPLSSAELYDPVNQSWTLTSYMNEARGGHTSTLLSDGRVMVAGGTAYGSELFSIEVYDPATGTWDYNPFALNVPHSAHTATLLPSGHVLIAGGSSFGNVVDTVEDCDPGNPSLSIPPSCSLLASMNFARAAHTATLVGSGTNAKVLVTGGYDSSFNSQDTSELYVISGSPPSWVTTGSLIDDRLGHTASLLSSGKVLVVGGKTQGGGPTAYRSSAELYDPAAGTWSADASMSTARVFHTASVLSSGHVLVTGGYSGSSNVGTSVEYTP